MTRLLHLTGGALCLAVLLAVTLLYRQPEFALVVSVVAGCG